MITQASPAQYEFVAPRRIVFGWARRREAGTICRTLGRRGWLICGSKRLRSEGVVDQLSADLAEAGVELVELADIGHEPEVADVDRAAADLRSRGPDSGDFVLGLGGGSAVDMAKAVAAMATNCESETVQDYLEGVGRGLKLTTSPLPVIAMPTTAGTGAEATKNAVISSYEPAFKKSLRDVGMVPQVALIDPELAVTVPPDITAASGMDAITQLIESYISRKAQPVPQALAIDGLRAALPSIAEAVRQGDRLPPRQRMAHAALLSGMALANSGLGMAHGVAPALGVHCRVPHGVACALMLPLALRVNRDAKLGELAHLARACDVVPPSAPADEAVDQFIERIERLCNEVGVARRLSQVGVRREQIPDIVASSRGSSMSGNPTDITDEQLTALLEEIW